MGREREREKESKRGREREHLCHCYACCLVTTFFTVQQTEAMHEESRPLRKQKSEKMIFSVFRRGFLKKAFLRETHHIRVGFPAQIGC